MLATLKAYKEFLAILVFFAGGFAWIESRYTAHEDFSGLSDTMNGVRQEMATQRDVARLKCLLTEYMTLTHLQIRAQDLEKEIERLTGDLSDPRLASADLEANPALMMVVADHEERLRMTRGDLKEVNDEITRVTEALQRHECEEN